MSPQRKAKAEEEQADGERTKLVADNRRAFFNYAIDEKVEAGIALTGSEIKSIRGGRVDLRDGYAKIDRGSAWLRNVRIARWPQASAWEPDDPMRVRRLLLHREQIDHLAGAVSQRGYTIVPLRLYLKAGKAKVELGLAKGKRQYEKRQVIKERDAAREMDAAIKRRMRGG
ncbi:MAG TPA: SsrA-binding protein SmpB [Candidatus Limnocylindria bacterium]